MQAQDDADALGDGGGQGRRPDAPMEAAHKQQVQNHIEDGGANQVVEGMLAVPHGLENAHKDVVHHHKDGAAEIDPEIHDGVGQYVVRRFHPLENGGSEGDAQHREDDACHQAEGYVGMYGQGHAPLVFGAEVLGDDHAGAHGDAVEEAHHHENQTARRSDRGQSRLVQESTDNQGVCRVVHLLKNVAQQDGHGKEQQLFPDDTLGQGVLIRFQVVPS